MFACLWILVLPSYLLFIVECISSVSSSYWFNTQFSTNKKVYFVFLNHILVFKLIVIIVLMFQNHCKFKELQLTYVSSGYNSSSTSLGKRSRYNSAKLAPARTWKLWRNDWSSAWPNSTITITTYKGCDCQWYKCEDQILWYMHAVQTSPMFSLFDMQ